MQAFLRLVTTFGLPEDRKAARKLERMGVKLHPLAAGRLTIVILIGLGALAVALKYRNVALLGATFAGGALLVTYFEWMLGRRESSMDKFFERLELANKQRDEVEHGSLKMDEFHGYVFAELDNLEYVIERYRFGYMSPSLALRAVRTFGGRFGIQGFDEVVGRLALWGSYSPRTCIVVRKLQHHHRREKQARSRSEPAPVRPQPSDRAWFSRVH
jgi:hypothetical protein